MADIYFLVLPHLPSDGLQTYTASYTMQNWGYQQQNCGVAGYGLQAVNPLPYAFFTLSDKAHAEAQRLSKLHQMPYHVAQVNIIGQYIPPPPEWKPTYKETLGLFPGTVTWMDKP